LPDYDRLQFCDKETQLKGFARQLKLADEVQLPMFLHMRAAAQDFVELCQTVRKQKALTLKHANSFVHLHDSDWQQWASVPAGAFYADATMSAIPVARSRTVT